LLIKTDESAARLKPVEVRERTRETQAAAIRQKNQSDEASIPKDGLMDVTRDLDRIGAPMFTTDFVKRLKKINSNFHYERSLKDPNMGGIYILHSTPIRPDGERREFVSRCEPTLMPEYQIFRPRTEERPDPTIIGHTRKVQTVDDMIWGWRTVLAKLLRSRKITLSQIERVFGLPTKDSQRWQVFTGQTLL